MKALLYPFQIDVNGHVATTEDYGQVVRGQIIDVLVTNYNERVMRPSYGANLQGALFDPSEELTRSDAANQVSQKIGQWAPRVLLNYLTFRLDPSTPAGVWVDANYRAGPLDNGTSLRFPVSNFLSTESQV